MEPALGTKQEWLSTATSQRSIARPRRHRHPPAPLRLRGCRAHGSAGASYGPPERPKYQKNPQRRVLYGLAFLFGWFCSLSPPIMVFLKPKSAAVWSMRSQWRLCTSYLVLEASFLKGKVDLSGALTCSARPRGWN